MKDYMSGDELYRYLHISKRKMKYLLENGYNPMIDTGMKTHRYRIKYEDARAFKRRMEEEPGCLSELTGMFTTSGPRKKTPPLFEPTEENCKAFAKYLCNRFHKWPDALTMREAAEMTSMGLQHISGLCAKKKIDFTVIKGKRYCSKESLLIYLSSAEVILGTTKQEGIKALIVFSSYSYSTVQPEISGETTMPGFFPEE